MSAGAVIITRAEPGAGETAKRVRALGLQAIISPVLSLHRVEPLPDIPIDGASGILFTSANGVRFFTEVCAELNCKAWCVGPATLEAAQRAGFTDCVSADGASRDLVDLVVREGDPDRGHLLHVANTAAAGNVRADLMDAGFDVRFVGLYEPVGAESLSQDALRAMSENARTCVLIHSAKGAYSFARLIDDTQNKNLTFICVSQNAAEPVRGSGETRIAARPNEEELLQELKDWTLAL